MPLPETASVSVTTVEPETSVNVIEPVGLEPPDNTAESFKVTAEVPRVTEDGLGVVTIDGEAGLTTVCSAAPP